MSMETVNDIDINAIETLKEGIEEFSKKLIEEASNYSEFRTDMIRTAIALSQGKYGIANPEELKGLEKDNIDTILLTYNCFGSLKAIIKTKKGTDRIISIKIIEDEEVKKLTELMKIQHTTLKKILEKTKEEKEKELKKKAKEMKELKETIINHLVEKEDYDGLKKLLWFYGDPEDYRFAIEIAKEKGKDLKTIVEIISDIEGLEEALELLKEFGIDLEEFNK